MSVIIYSAKLTLLLLDERHLCTPSRDPFHSYDFLYQLSYFFFAEVANTIIHRRRRDGSELPRPTWQLVPINFSKMRRNARVLCGRYKSFRIGISDSNNRRLKANHTRGPGLCLASLFLLPLPYTCLSMYHYQCITWICKSLDLTVYHLRFTPCHWH